MLFTPTNLLLILSIALLVRAPVPRPESSNPEPEGGRPIEPAGFPAPETPQSDPLNNYGEHPPLANPDPDPTVPHAAVAPAYVEQPEHPTQEEKSESELGEVLEKIADAIESVVDAFNNNASPTGTDTIIPGIAAPVGPTTTPAPEAAACLSASEVYTNCYSATSSPNFFSLLRTDQASCLCYATVSGSWYWEPSSFDGYMTSCNSYAQTQNISTSQAAVRAGISSGVGLCASAGNVRTTALVVTGNMTITSTAAVTSGPTSTVAPTTSPITPAKTSMGVGRVGIKFETLLLGLLALSLSV